MRRAFLTMLGAALAVSSAAGGEPPKKMSLDLGEGVKLDLVLIPAGKFMMGLPEAVRRAHNYPHIVGAPLHEVTITKPFHMGTYEVTYEQYWAVMGKDNCPYDRAAKKRPAILKTRVKGPEYPVDYVAPRDALAFCAKASKRTGKTVRLPTEAEWEYACRAGTTTRFSFGDDAKLGKAYGWWKSNTKDGVNRPAKVGLLKPNPWGLYDMHGNACEYCGDTYLTKTFPKGPAVDPHFPPKRGKVTLVIRGGEYLVGLWDSTRRYGVSYAGNAHGFRVVVTAPAPETTTRPASPAKPAPRKAAAPPAGAPTDADPGRASSDRDKGAKPKSAPVASGRSK